MSSSATFSEISTSISLEFDSLFVSFKDKLQFVGTDLSIRKEILISWSLLSMFGRFTLIFICQYKRQYQLLLVCFSDFSCQNLLPKNFLQFRFHGVLMPSYSNFYQKPFMIILLHNTIMITWRCLSKSLSIKIVSSHLSFTCSFTTIVGGECSYHFSTHSWPSLLDISQFILRDNF